MKYVCEVEMVVDGVTRAKGEVVENPSEVKVDMVAITDDAPKAAPAKKAEPKVEAVEVQEEILTEDSASVEVVEEEAEEAPATSSKKKGGKNKFAQAVDRAKSKIGK